MSDSSVSTKRIALVTGANKGIGYSIVKLLAKTDPSNLLVLLGARDEAKGKEAKEKLQKEEGLNNVEFVQFDVSDFSSIEKAVASIFDKYSKIDILVNNAGIAIDFGESFIDEDISKVVTTLQTNTLGPLRLSQLIVPVMRKNNFGRIVNVSSGAGQLSDMNGKHIGYRMSKVALNCVTRVINDEDKDFNILVNSVCPGFVNTDLTGGRGKKTPDEGADTAVWLATLPTDGPRGGFFRNRQPIPW